MGIDIPQELAVYTLHMFAEQEKKIVSWKNLHKY